MISGPWGCGKTFFIKNTLLGKIKEIKDLECGDDKEMDIKKNILEKDNDYLILDSDKNKLYKSKIKKDRHSIFTLIQLLR